MRPLPHASPLRVSRAFVAGAIALAAAFASAPAAAQEGAPAFHAESCPVPATVAGYPVSVRAADGSPLDSAYARALATAVAYRWQPPSPRRASFAGLRRVRDRIVPPAPRWPDDWRPEARHTARLEVTLQGGERAGKGVLLASSPDRAFNATLPRAVDDDPTGQHPLPALPAGLDSARVIISFGMAPEPADAGVARFAVQQRPVRVVAGTLRVMPPPPAGRESGRPTATAKYDVGADGRIVPSSIQVVQSSSAAFGRNVQEGLRQASFTPAEHDCRAIPLSVIQEFGR